MELVKEKGQCCGCGTCEHVCPKSAITMMTDEQGFLYPEIDAEKCVDCGLCLKKCAFQSGYQKRKEYEPFYGYAARHKDAEIMMKSRSGGAFTAISDLILAEGGVVYGAGYDEEQGFFKVVHKRAETEEQRNEFRGSKYAQSDLNRVFCQIKEDLKDGRRVLFTGTGCQVGALYSFLGKEYDNLLTMDIVCHGVGSPKLWADFLNMREAEKGGRITGADFRDKEKFGWKKHCESVWVDGQKYSSKLFAKLFLKDLAERPSCFQCIYANKNRVGDITIADFWGHEKAVPEFHDDDKGISLVLVNNQKGNEIWKRAAEAMDVQECTGYPYRHGCMKHPTKRPDEYEEFWKDYQERGFAYIMKKYCSYDVAIPAKQQISAAKQGKKEEAKNQQTENGESFTGQLKGILRKVKKKLF